MCWVGDPLTRAVFNSIDCDSVYKGWEGRGGVGWKCEIFFHFSLDRDLRVVLIVGCVVLSVQTKRNA